MFQIFENEAYHPGGGLHTVFHGGLVENSRVRVMTGPWFVSAVHMTDGIVCVSKKFCHGGRDTRFAKMPVNHTSHDDKSRVRILLGHAVPLLCGWLQWYRMHVKSNVAMAAG